jgi:hypothetical protein
MTMPYTLAQLTFNQSSVYAVCSHCGHFRSITLAEIMTYGGGQSLVADIERRMRCRTCKQRKCKLQPDRPAIGERVCPRCLRPYWK